MNNIQSDKEVLIFKIENIAAHSVPMAWGTCFPQAITESVKQVSFIWEGLSEAGDKSHSANRRG